MSMSACLLEFVVLNEECILTKVINVFVVFQVTLNMLNASESEVDVDGLENDVKLDFETNDEEDT